MNLIKRSFQPLTHPHVEVLILGSLPGDASLAINEYYGHPQNRFWKVLSQIFEGSFKEFPNYQSKLDFLIQHKLALWDVVNEAERKGSLDSSIRNVYPNPIPEFIKAHEELKLVVFNGKKAEKLYETFFQRIETIRYLTLPSTSPANRKFNFDQMIEEWSKIKRETG